MTPKAQLVQALAELCKREGGHIAVADVIGVNDQTLYQVVSGVKLPSGEPRGVGPKLQKALEQHYPGWASLGHVAREPVGAYNLQRDIRHHLAAVANALVHMAPAHRTEAVQVFQLLASYPDEADYVERLAKLLERAPAERGQPRSQQAS